jgi:hypothetical protein
LAFVVSITISGLFILLDDLEGDDLILLWRLGKELSARLTIFSLSEADAGLDESTTDGRLT